MPSSSRHKEITRQTSRDSADKYPLSTQLKYRGKEELEENLSKCEKNIKSMQDYVREECTKEIEAFQEAQAKLESKMSKVLKSEKMTKMEDEINDVSFRVSKSLNNVQRQIANMHDDVDHAKGMSREETERQHREIDRFASEELHRLSDAYPSAIRAQILSQLPLRLM